MRLSKMAGIKSVMRYKYLVKCGVLFDLACTKHLVHLDFVESPHITKLDNILPLSLLVVKWMIYIIP